MTVKSTIRKVLQVAVEKHGWELTKKERSTSETSKCRERLAPFCTGYGIDIGPGGDPITETAVRVDLPQPYTKVGKYKVQLGGDCRALYWFKDNSLDYVYSSHVLEDFAEIEPILREWLRVLKPGGNLILFCPDQKAYEAHCNGLKEKPNPYHKDPNFSINTVKRALDNIGRTRNIHETPLIDIYSWELVAQKLTSK